jgi:hypothetical protein
MYYPKERATPPNRPDGRYIDKFAAANILGIHPETLLSGMRDGKIKLTPVVEKTPKRRRQFWFSLDHVWAEYKRRQEAKGESGSK